MEQTLLIYNTLTRKKEAFKSINPGHVGMYVCGPTVYGDAHLGHARPAITFDIIYRYLQHIGYKVRYVRNITDVGHLEHDADEGEDKIAKKARLEQLVPPVISLSSSSSYSRFSTMDMLISQTVRYISTSKNTTKTTNTASYQDALSKISRTLHATHSLE